MKKSAVQSIVKDILLPGLSQTIGSANALTNLQVIGKDIVIDLRPESSSYLKTFECELSAEDKQQLFVPKGFAHGYAVLSEEAVVLYKADAPYFPESEGGIVPTDPFFQLDWGVPKEAQIIHQRDLNWPLWKQA